MFSLYWDGTVPQKISYKGLVYEEFGTTWAVNDAHLDYTCPWLASWLGSEGTGWPRFEELKTLVAFQKVGILTDTVSVSQHDYCRLWWLSNMPV